MRVLNKLPNDTEHSKIDRLLTFEYFGGYLFGMKSFGNTDCETRHVPVHDDDSITKTPDTFHYFLLEVFIFSPSFSTDEESHRCAQRDRETRNVLGQPVHRLQRPHRQNTRYIPLFVSLNQLSVVLD